MELYDYTDKALTALNRRYLRLFRRLKLLNLDELNVVNQVVTVYRQADKLAKSSYLDIAIEAYLFAITMAEGLGYETDIPDKSETPITSDWVEEMLEEADAVTLYEYAPEWERKRQRLIEALAATNKPNQEIDKALKYAAQQVSHYADKATMESALKAYRDAGVKKAEVVTEKDDRVCNICRPLDGKIFDIDKVPKLPLHWRCRCILRPVER